MLKLKLSDNMASEANIPSTKKLKARLRSLKTDKRESYETVIWKLIYGEIKPKRRTGPRRTKKKKAVPKRRKKK